MIYAILDESTANTKFANRGEHAKMVLNTISILFMFFQKHLNTKKSKNMVTVFQKHIKSHTCSDGFQRKDFSK